MWKRGKGRIKYGKWKPGLLELGLVKRSGSGTRAYPHVYHLTEAGKHVLEEIETLFPDVFKEK